MKVIKTLDDIFESDLFKKMEAEDEKALKESGWTRKEIDQIANFIIKNNHETINKRRD